MQTHIKRQISVSFSLIFRKFVIMEKLVAQDINLDGNGF